jgi:hypothetical protein
LGISDKDAFLDKSPHRWIYLLLDGVRSDHGSCDLCFGATWKELHVIGDAMGQ